LGQTYKLTRRTVYGITSLSPQQASAADLLRFDRQHWTIENKLHWVKDVIFGEDGCQLREGRTHQLMALFYNLAISILRANGWQSIAGALRFYAAHPHEALALVSQPVGE
jgi:hypothetical protein